MAKQVRYYKVIKDHPMWEVGAILHNIDSNGDSSENYYPINDLHIKEIKGLNGSWHEGGSLIENQTEWFERVYKISVLKQVKYLRKDKAREAHDKLYSEK